MKENIFRKCFSIFSCLVGLNVLENVFQINSFSSNLRKMTSLQNLRKTFSKTLFQLPIKKKLLKKSIYLVPTLKPAPPPPPKKK
uniref:Putative ovule protein n=1 Tax=Solanum chacoense TaxID=4108 RepID=A0A0V0H9K6_SOLCH